MHKKFAIGAVLAAVLVTAPACGNDAVPAPAPAANATAPATAARTTAAARAATVTPDQVCALVTTAQMSQTTGFTITSTKTEMSGDVSVCHYIGTAAGTTFASSKMLLEYAPTGKAAVEYTKSRGEAVPGIGVFAVYFSTAGQLSVEVGGDAVFHVFVEDVRAKQNDPKGAAVQIAQLAVPRLPHA